LKILAMLVTQSERSTEKSSAESESASSSRLENHAERDLAEEDRRAVDTPTDRVAREEEEIAADVVAHLAATVPPARHRAALAVVIRMRAVATMIVQHEAAAAVVVVEEQVELDIARALAPSADLALRTRGRALHQMALSPKGKLGTPF